MPLPTEKFINDAKTVVAEALNGLCANNENIALLESCDHVVIRRDVKQHVANKVSLVAGGGAGHEPYPTGYVGRGLLTAAVSGNVFASPPSRHVSEAIRATSSSAGTVVFIINYTGDRLNFGVAVERYKAQGGKIEVVTIADDIALRGFEPSIGARGLAGAVLVIKIAGSMSEMGYPIAEIVGMSESVNKNMATLGVSLKACSVPGQAPTFELPHGELEVGLGIHGERGRRREKLRPVREVVADMVRELTTHLQIRGGSRVILMLNNLGGTTDLEMNIIKADVMAELESAKVEIVLIFIGTYMTSLEGHGFSITLLNLPAKLETQIVQHLTSETKCAAWKAPLRPVKNSKNSFATTTQVSNDSETQDGYLEDDETASKFEHSIKAVISEMKIREGELNELDRDRGDGDTGTSFYTFATAVEKQLAYLKFHYPAQLLQQLSGIVESEVGGTTGALCAIMLSAASAAFRDSSSPAEELGARLHLALRLALDSLMHHGGAAVGDKTMVDSLSALVCSLDTEHNWKHAIERMRQAAIDTKHLKARSGRAAYTAQQESDDDKPDAGAMAIYYWINSAATEINTTG